MQALRPRQSRLELGKVDPKRAWRVCSPDRHVGESGKEDSRAGIKTLQEWMWSSTPGRRARVCCVGKFDYTFIGFVRANMLTLTFVGCCSNAITNWHYTHLLLLLNFLSIARVFDNVEFQFQLVLNTSHGHIRIGELVVSVSMDSWCQLKAMWASFLFEGIYPLIFGTPIISTADRVCNFGGYSWRHKYSLFCVRVSLVINITQPIHVCVKHRYPHLSTCPVWRFGHPSKLDIFQVHAALSSPKQNGLIISKSHHDKNLCFTFTSLRFHVATSSARFAAQMEVRKLILAFLYVYLPLSTLPQNVIPLHPLPLCYSLSNKNLSTDLHDCPLWFRCLYHIHLSLVISTITQLVCVAGVHRLTTRASTLTVTMVLVIRRAISLIISMIDIMHVGRTFRGLNSLTSAKLCHVLGLDESTLWNLFGVFWMSWSGRLAFLLPSSLSLEEGNSCRRWICGWCGLGPSIYNRKSATWG